MAAWGDGGGFMPPDSQDTPQRKFASRHDNVVPCTIAQIHMMNQDTLMIGSLEVQYVSLVGLVTSVDQQSTRVNFTLDDRTGPPIEGLIFAQEEAMSAQLTFSLGVAALVLDLDLDEALLRLVCDLDLERLREAGPADVEQTRVLSHLVEGSYVRVVGPVRSADGKRQLKAFKVFPVTDLNELSLHLAEVVHANMALRVRLLIDIQTADNSADLKMPLVKAIYFASGACRDMKSQTVLHCFRKGDFLRGSSTTGGETAAAEIGAAAGVSTIVMSIGQHWESVLYASLVPSNLNYVDFALADGGFVATEDRTTEEIATSISEKESIADDSASDIKSRDLYSIYRSSLHIAHVPRF
ncbi:hypothetical protein HPB50_011593 [Hyalomma asiaticum]|uniref:Uncharacterized protein n=1 Tax=Hyalomma asiaticum TaxID=266040 RepID=A0ACB7STY1_HYAAI|nr:hypothetical protein HPB50_011593 [Hyalomma asiaticum]